MLFYQLRINPEQKRWELNENLKIAGSTPAWAIKKLAILDASKIIILAGVRQRPV